MGRARRTALTLGAALALLRLAACAQGQGAVVVEAADEAPTATGTLPLTRYGTHRLRALGEVVGEGELVCEDVTKLDAGDDFCAFVRNHCVAESVVNYPLLYYCHVAPHGLALTLLMLLCCACLLALLFRVIGRTADAFFSCILSQISQDLGLPPRLGGVTLLALGNGAPDLSASIAAVKSGNYQLAMGALTGAGMFVGCVVAGRIITLSGGVRARGAQLRDIATQFITVAVVVGIVASGTFTYGGVAALLSIYVAYVVVVAVADFSKRAGVEWGEVARKVSRSVSKRWRVELAAPLLAGDHGGAAAAAGELSPGRLPQHRQPPPQQQQFELEEAIPEGQAHEGALPGSRSLSPAPRGPTLGLSRSLSPTAAATSLPALQQARSSSMPDVHAARQQPQSASWHQLQQPSHEPHHHHSHRQGPPVAHFQPRVAYSDLVQMSAAEYRRRALAEMAQSTSFYARDRRGEEAGVPPQQQQQQEEGDECSSESSDDEGSYPRSSPARSSPVRGEPAAWDAGGAYQPPLVSLDPRLLRPPGRTADIAAAAAAAVAEADAAEAGGAGVAAAPAAADHKPAGCQLKGQDQHGSGQSRNSSVSINSFEMVRAADAAAAAVAAADFEPRTPPGPGGAGCGLDADLGWQDDVPPGRLRRVADAAQRPIMLLLEATIPLVEANSYRRELFLRSLAASPLFVCAYLRLFTWQALLSAAGAGAAMAGAAHLGTLRLQGKAPMWTLGTGYPVGAALVAMYGFAVAAMWISLFASEIVGVLQFIGMLSKVDPAALGVTLLAWGNSLMDYMNNTAMAGRSRGGNSMAMTACFAGPLFNMLVGLGLGFWALLGESGGGAAAVELDPVVLVGCVGIMANCAALVGVSLAHRQHLPSWCGWAMVGMYCLYLLVVLAVMALT